MDREAAIIAEAEAVAERINREPEPEPRLAESALDEGLASDAALLTPFERALLDRLDHIIEMQSARGATQRRAVDRPAKPTVKVQKTESMGKTYVRETNLDTGEVRKYTE